MNTQDVNDSLTEAFKAADRAVAKAQLKGEPEATLVQLKTRRDKCEHEMLSATGKALQDDSQANRDLKTDLDTQTAATSAALAADKKFVEIIGILDKVVTAATKLAAVLA